MFSDQHHIEMIRERLFKGNVSVMVGAGFSLNATQLSGTKGSFLTWTKLIDELKSKLYLNEEDKKYASNDPLKLAAEFEFEFGRGALEELLRLSLPDDNYIPGDLHKMLLTIPWEDIYTTNYDTLIERTREFVYDNYYTLVQTVQDIPNSVKPRIVKLHGSFPSHRPFVFSEEDYRIYPKKFSPFVNLVQQSIMENTFCLVGFSGEDPNFKKWIGWIRDNLGDHASSIYFCGFLNESQKRNLEVNNIKVINFTNLYNSSNYQLDHEYALKWFFLELLKPDLYIPYKWPEINKFNPLSEWDIPVQVKERLSYTDKVKIESQPSEDFEEILNQWKNERERYPRWIIAPRRARNYIWHHMDASVMNMLIKQKDKTLYKEYINILYEFTWRLETGLLSLSIPRFRPFIPIIEEFVDRYIEYKENKEKLIEIFSVDENEIHVLVDKLVRLGFILVKYYRECFEVNKASRMLENLEEVIFTKSEFIAEYYYQQCLLELNQFNYQKVKELLNQWPSNFNIPYWEVKRSSILNEIKDYKMSEQILLASLNEIRSRNIQGEDFELLSQESWILRLLASIKGRDIQSNLYNNVEREEFTKVVNCDANRIYEEVITGVDGSLIRQQEKITVSFDPGMEITSMSFNNDYDNNYKSSIQIFKMVENTGHRFRIKDTVFDKDRIFVACEYVARDNFLLALHTLIQLGNKKYLKAFLSRERLAIINKDIADSLFRNIYESLCYLNEQRTMKQIDTFYDNRFSILLEVLSRLTIRLTNDQLEDCFHLAMKIYTSLPNSDRLHTFGKELNNLFKRILYACDENKIINNVNELLKLPLINEQLIIDPINFVVKADTFKKRTKISKGIIDKDLVDSLIRKIRMSGEHDRFVIILRLLICNRLLLLSDDQKNMIGLLLSEGKFANIGINFSAVVEEFLIGNLKYNKFIINKYKDILEKEFDNITSKNRGIIYSFPPGSTFEKDIDEITNLLINNDYCINFTYFEESIKKLVTNLEKWWDENKEDLGQPLHGIQKLSWVIYRGFLNALMYVIPRVKEENEKVYRILKDLESINVLTSSLYPVKLSKGYINESTAVMTLIDNLHSTEKEKVFDSLQGIFQWIDLSEQKILPKLPIELINELIQKAFLRRAPYLDQSFKLLTYLTESQEYTYSSNQIEKMIDALNNLYKETNISSFVDDNLGVLKKVDLLPIRAKACELAYALNMRMKKEDIDIPESLSQWKEESNNSTIPEIKKAWKTI